MRGHGRYRMENIVIAFMMIILFAFGSIVVYCFNRFLNEMYKNSSEDKRTRAQLKDKNNGKKKKTVTLLR